MKLPQLVEGRFIERANRFACWVEIEGKRRSAFLPNSGRLKDLLIPRRTVFLTPNSTPKRKTDYDLLLASFDDVFVSIDARLPPILLAEAIPQLEPFKGFSILRKEVALGKERIDLLLSCSSEYLFIETKSVTLVRDGIALFPDAPTKRGRRHIEALLQARREGFRTAIAFIVQRPDASLFSPNKIIDPSFANSLKEAKKEGLEVYAFSCQVNSEEIKIEREIPVEI